MQPFNIVPAQLRHTQNTGAIATLLKPQVKSPALYKQRGTLTPSQLDLSVCLQTIFGSLKCWIFRACS